jgi:hypothetical protein
MGTAIAVVVVVLVVLFVLTKLANSITKSTQKIQGRNRCKACGSRLKAVNGVYAGTCRKCGAVQPWATTAATGTTAATPPRVIGDLFKKPE